MALPGKSAGPGDLGSQPIRTRRNARTAPEPSPALVPSDEWLSVSSDEDRMARAGIKLRGGGPHQSKTMMLVELTTLFVNRGADKPTDAIIRDNVLAKPSMRARQAALCRLRQL